MYALLQCMFLHFCSAFCCVCSMQANICCIFMTMNSLTCMLSIEKPMRASSSKYYNKHKHIKKINKHIQKKSISTLKKINKFISIRYWFSTIIQIIEIQMHLNKLSKLFNKLESGEGLCVLIAICDKK